MASHKGSFHMWLLFNSQEGKHLPQSFQVSQFQRETKGVTSVLTHQNQLVKHAVYSWVVKL